MIDNSKIKKLVVDSIKHHNRNLKNAGFMFLGGGLLCLTLGIFAYLSGESGPGGLFLALATFFLLIGIPMTKKYLENYSPESSEMYRTIFLKTESIVWLYIHRFTQNQTILGIPIKTTTVYTLYLGLKSGKRIHMQVKEENLKEIVEYIREFAPDAMVGYTKENEKKFTEIKERRKNGLIS